MSGDNRFDLLLEHRTQHTQRLNQIRIQRGGKTRALVELLWELRHPTTQQILALWSQRYCLPTIGTNRPASSLPSPSDVSNVKTRKTVYVVQSATLDGDQMTIQGTGEMGRQFGS